MTNFISRENELKAKAEIKVIRANAIANGRTVFTDEEMDTMYPVKAIDFDGNVTRFNENSMVHNFIRRMKSSCNVCTINGVKY